MGRKKLSTTEQGQRIHAYFKKKVLKEMDKAVKKQKISRSKFISQAVEDKLMIVGKVDGIKKH